MDLSKLSDADLKAAYEGNWQGVSDDGLRLLSGTPEQVGTGEDIARSAASGVARSIPKGIDFGGAVVAKGVDLATGGNTPFSTFMDASPLNKLTSKVLGEEYEPQTGAGSVAKFGGEVLGPWGALSAARGTAGFARGLAGKAPEYVKDPAVLLQRYKDGVEALSNIKFTPQQLRDGLKKPVNEAIAPDFFANKSPELANDLSNLDRLTKTGTDGRRLEGFRRSLSSTKDPLANRLREGVDDFLESSAVPTDFRDSYRLMSKVRNLDDAITKGGDNLPMARTALKNQLIGKNARGYTPAELATLRTASKAGPGETSLRLLSAATGLPSSIAAGVGGNPVAGGLLYSTSRGLKNLADKQGLKRIEEARNLILNGGEMPTIAERFGTFVRGKLK
ncbi:hypothetical protein [Agrobacterium tumefaciens]|uniref:Uncharacterized protein n=1 Tax=Agrobacterium tumefaciens TaxID=358 RepID=A0A176WXR8_AGRTU|nr:hypothetical protein [Agrobacterium tumefaciens]OAE37636.1 hypothetical protein A7J57_08645 [Agrobacterium tumefaciens]